MAKASRPVKTITINKSRDIIVDRLLKQCEEDNHSMCTGWAVLKKEISPIDANYFLKCTCACHHKKAQSSSRKKKPKKSITTTSRKVKRKAKKKAKRKQKQRPVKRSKKKSRKTRKR